MNTNPGNRIKRLRERLGLSPYELADRVGVGFQRVYEWESGQTPSSRYVVALARVLGTSTDYLLTGQHAEVARHE